MEGIHGIDVSWLHHSQKDNRSKSPSRPAPVPAAPAKSPENPTPGAAVEPLPTTSNGQNTQTSPSPTQQPHRPHIFRSSSDKSAFSGQKESTASSQLSVPTTPPPSTGRRGSWLSSLSSKFSSSPSPQASPHAPPPSSTKAQPDKTPHAAHNPAVLTTNSEDATKNGEKTLPVPNTTRSSHPSFLQSALRRLSSSSAPSSGSPSKPSGPTGRVERKVMNVDPNRARCRIQELDAGKLRRVSFCVDVEIAGIPRYEDDWDVGKRALDESQKEKEKRLKERGEGEALKHPEELEKERKEDGVIKATGESVEPDSTKGESSNLRGKPETKAADKKSSKKKEKKKRSEEERKDRKERKRKLAESNGTIPIEHKLEIPKPVVENESSHSTPPSSSTPRPQDKPTTDPLRIYKRCCQLRETQTLKKLSEQLATPEYADTGVVSCLDLSGYFFPQFADIVTFGDFLALVPVKKLMLEDCGLGDEGVRVILAGLLAVRKSFEDSPVGDMSDSIFKEQANGESTTPRFEIPKTGKSWERHGAIEKLSLKSNSKIGRDGWRYISLFIHMSRSIKAIDLSMVPFPQEISPPNGNGSTLKIGNGKPPFVDIATILSKAIGERLAGAHLEELVLAECELDAEQIGKLVDGVIKSGTSRLGLASNHMDQEGLEHVARYVRESNCQGLDLGGNDLGSLTGILAEAVHDDSPLYALSLADCNLTPSSLSKLFPALVSLPNFRFIDLSHNHALFETQPDALSLIRKYLPRLRMLKRIHLMDVALTPEHAIALAEILPEIPNLAHLNILENPKLAALTSSDDEASQEEASALYASLMTAVKVSDTIICIDVDVPGESSNEVVKALAKQVLAYCLRNMERGPIAEFGSGGATTGESHGDKKVVIPDVLLHLVGTGEEDGDHQNEDEAMHDDDYVVGGTGIVKALSVCLGNRSHSANASGTTTPKVSLSGLEYGRGKALDMSKSLLDSARKIRSRLQPALAREAKMGDDLNHRKLVFLDQTLARMIQRFEDEYPECRLCTGSSASVQPSDQGSDPGSTHSSLEESIVSAGNQIGIEETDDGDDTILTEEDDEDKPKLSRHNSDVSLASRALSNEEGRMHRFGQRIRREVLRPQSLDHAHGTTGEEVEAEHLTILRDKLESMKGEEIKEHVKNLGADAFFRELGTDAQDLETLAREDPEEFERFKTAHLMAQHNMTVNRLGDFEFPEANTASNEKTDRGNAVTDDADELDPLSTTDPKSAK